MFRRLADQISSAVASVAASSPLSSSSPSQSPVDTLKSMGFSESEARHALQVSGDNVEQAAEWLLMNGRPTMASAVTAQTEDDELQMAIDASLMAEAQAAKQQQQQQQRQAQSAASFRAGQAALARFEQAQGNLKPKRKPNKVSSPPRSANSPTRPAATSTAAATTTPGTMSPKSAPSPLLPSHPNVKVPKRLSQHDKEEQILRCAARIAPHPMAVDTLLKSLKQLQQNPSNPVYKTIDTSTAGFQRSLNAPGVLDFFKAMNYHPSYSNPKILHLSMLDPATLYLGISALEQVQETSTEYKENKTRILFEKEIQQILGQADSNMEEAVKRSQFISKCPSEPTTGGGIITVDLGSTKISRKFDGDDTLEDVLHWIGGHGSIIYEKLLNQEWFLVNANHANTLCYNITELKTKTLQYIGCWPSGRLAIVPTAPTPSKNDRMPSSSRGLGAAPMDHLKL